MTREECIKVIKALWRYKDCGYSDKEIRESLDMAINALEAEIVTCKDCKHCEKRYNGIVKQTFYICEDEHCNDGTVECEMIVEPDFYCAYGEKTDENERTLKYADQDTMMPAT